MTQGRNERTEVDAQNRAKSEDCQEEACQRATVLLLLMMADLGLKLSSYGHRTWQERWDKTGTKSAKAGLDALAVVLAGSGFGLTAEAMLELGIEAWPEVTRHYDGEPIVEWSDPEAEERFSDSVVSAVLAEYPDALDDPTIH